METENSLYISLDSDVLRAVADLDYLLTADPNYDYSNSKDFMVKAHGDFFIELLKKIKSGEVKIFVGNTVYHEVKHRRYARDFIVNYCYFKRINYLNFDKITKEIDDLALAYCTESYRYGSDDRYPPLKLRYDPIQRKYMPSNDAYAVAESSHSGCMFVTGNGQDLVFDKNIADDNTSRSQGIRVINYRHDYKTETEDGKTLTPTTCELSYFIHIIRKYGWDNFVSSQCNPEEFEKVSEMIM